MAITEELRARVELTVSCNDTERLSKIDGAGEVHDGVQLMHNGLRIEEGCYHGEWMTEIIRRLRGHHEPQEEVVVHAILEQLALAESGTAPVVVELGAFWSYYALWALQRLSGARAILVEPDPHNLEIGRRNFALNGREGEFRQASMGAVSGPPVPFVCESDGLTRLVPIESLRSIVDGCGVDRVDVVFADIQGAEFALLEGARSLLAAGRVRFLVVSTHHHSISGDPLTHQRCLDLLASAGAHVIAEHTVAESFSGDGLIAASFDKRDQAMAVAVGRARAGASLFEDPLHDVARLMDELAAARIEAVRAGEELAAARGSLALQQALTAAPPAPWGAGADVRAQAYARIEALLRLARAWVGPRLPLRLGQMPGTLGRFRQRRPGSVPGPGVDGS